MNIGLDTIADDTHCRPLTLHLLGIQDDTIYLLYLVNVNRRKIKNIDRKRILPIVIIHFVNITFDNDSSLDDISVWTYYYYP